MSTPRYPRGPVASPAWQSPGNSMGETPLPASLDPANRRPRVYGRGARPAAPVTPWRLAESETEHGEQAALFCWANMAARLGFDAANEPAIYGSIFPGAPNVITEMICLTERAIRVAPVPVLNRLMAIPNGGQRDKITAGKLKAEGVKAGAPDIFLPHVTWTGVTVTSHVYAGLWVELKRLKYKTHRNGGMSDEQVEWGAYLHDAGYRFVCCHGWQHAASEIRRYIEGA